MFGIFILPSNPNDKEYPYKKDPKTPLKMTDEEFVNFIRLTPKMTYYCHYKDDYDKSPIEEKFKIVERYLDREYLSLKKLRGIEDSFQTESGEFYIKVIVKEKDWFSRYFV